MTIADQIQITEQLQELFDRRLRLLQDLEHVQLEIHTLLATMHEGTPFPPLPAARDESVRGRMLPGVTLVETAVDATASETEPPQRTSRKTQASARKATKPSAKGTQRFGRLTEDILGLLQRKPKHRFTADEVASETSHDLKKVRMTLNNLSTRKRIRRIGRGEFQSLGSGR